MKSLGIIHSSEFISRRCWCCLGWLGLGTCSRGWWNVAKVAPVPLHEPCPPVVILTVLVILVLQRLSLDGICRVPLGVISDWNSPLPCKVVKTTASCDNVRCVFWGMLQRPTRCVKAPGKEKIIFRYV